MKRISIVPFLVLLSPIAVSAAGCSSKSIDDEADLGTKSAAATKGLTYLSGKAAEIALGKTRQGLLVQLRKESGSDVKLTVDAGTGAVMTMDLGDGWVAPGGQGKPATEFLNRYQALIDALVNPAEYVAPPAAQTCDGTVAVFDRFVGGLQVVGSRMTVILAPDGRVVRIINGVASVPGKVGKPALQGSALSKLLPAKLSPKDLARHQALAPAPDRSSLMAVDVVSWPEASGKYAGALAVGDLAVSPVLHAAGAESAGPAAAHLDAGGVPDALDYRSAGGAIVNVLPGERNPAELAYRFMEENPSIYRSGIARCQFAPKTVSEDAAALGTSFVRVEQRHAGVPVVGNELLFQINGGRVVSVLGASLPRIDLEPTPARSPSQAEAAVTAALNAARVRYPAQKIAIDAALAAPTHTRVVILPASPSRPGTPDTLAYEVTRRDLVVYVDARTLSVLAVESLQGNETDVNDAHGSNELGLLGFERVLTNVSGTPVGPGISDPAALAADAALQRVQSTYAALGRAGINGSGNAFVANLNVAMLATACPNAWFMPILDQAFFCAGTAVSDVVGHEIGHGVMFHTSNVGLSDQSGAINEAYADLMGQLMLPNAVVPPATRPGWVVGIDVPTGAFRDMANPGRAPFFDPAAMSAFIPRSPAAGCDVWPWSCDSGFVHANAGIVNRAHVLLTDGVSGLTAGIGRGKMLRLGFLTMTQRLMPGARMNQIPRATFDACRTLVAAGATDLSGAPFVTEDCNQIPIAFDRVGLSSDLTSGWTSVPVGFSGDMPFFDRGEQTANGCTVTDVRGAMTTLSGDVSVGLGAASGLPRANDWFGLRGLSFVVPPGAGPNPLPIGTTGKQHTVHWFDAFGGVLGRPAIATDVLAPPPAGAADCVTPTGSLPVEQFSETQLHSNFFGESGDSTIGNASSAMDTRCGLTTTTVEILNEAGRPLTPHGPSAHHRVSHDFVFFTLNFDQNVTITTPPPGAPNLQASVHWQYDIGREARFRLHYRLAQPIIPGSPPVACTP